MESYTKGSDDLKQCMVKQLKYKQKGIANKPIMEIKRNLKNDNSSKTKQEIKKGNKEPQEQTTKQQHGNFHIHISIIRLSADGLNFPAKKRDKKKRRQKINKNKNHQ